MQRDQVLELAWILPSVAIPIAMLVAIVITAFGMHISVPGIVASIDPATVNETPPFDKPGVIRTAPGRYEVAMVASTWSFRPNEIRVPVGSQVQFTITSVDVIHGMRVQGTNINVMIVPGQVSRATARFDTAGEFLFMCHEYCGVAHHVMAGKVIVEP
jgi:cytochrome c oxidase subunit 2